MNAEWNLYAAGYKMAWDKLINGLVPGYETNLLVYPAMFLYRQYVELRLKEIVQKTYWYLGVCEDFPGHHHLMDLWKICRTNVEKMDSDELARMSKDGRKEYRKEINALERGISELSKLDPESTAFRYPVDKHGNPITIDLPRINLKRIKSLLEGISKALDGVSVGVHESLKSKHETAAYSGNSVQT